MSSLDANFDAVLMLTWSDWHSEPRSNRYHYASRFASRLPVFFVQNQRDSRSNIVVTQSELPNLDIIDVAAPISEAQVSEIRTLLHYRGIRNPLVWIYDPKNYWKLIKSLPRYYRAYHATEDYFVMSFEDKVGEEEVRRQLRSLLAEVDTVVAVSEKVAQSVRLGGGYSRSIILAENGCDFEFFKSLEKKFGKIQECDKSTVIYQGGINSRLDYDLLWAIANRMPDFRFKFFGKIVESEGLDLLRSLSNVEIHNLVAPEVFSKEMFKATVGIVPFKQDELMFNSFPLKVFEYISCGLPVVSIPIHALEKYRSHSDIISFATTAEEFINQIKFLSTCREFPERIERGEKLAQLNSYNSRFKTVSEQIASDFHFKKNRKEPLNVAIFYDPASSHVGTVNEHLHAFKKYSSHSITYIPVANIWGQSESIDNVGDIDLSVFDVVVLHYSIRLSKRDHFNSNFAEALIGFFGLKVLFIQDEYESVECARGWMDRCQFDVVYTCVPLDQREKIYPSSRYPATDFISTLTGYVPESESIECFIRPLESRELAIVYRGRKLPFVYGKLGYEKYEIGLMAAQYAKDIDLPVDIAWDEDSRIYGDDWYRFLASGRATLGTESGSNVFDFDGSLSRRIEQITAADSNCVFQEIWDRVLIDSDGYVKMNQISPKIFEAIRLRTALVLFEGEYSGVVKPDVHYIPLKKDFSNFRDVVSKILDDDYIRAMTDRAYEDVISSGLYSYQRFIERIDADLRTRCVRRQSRRLMYGAIYIESDNGELKQCLPVIPLDLPCAAPILGSKSPFQRIHEAYIETVRSKLFGEVSVGSRACAIGNVKSTFIAHMLSLVEFFYHLTSRYPRIGRGLRWLYSRLPRTIRLKLRNSILGR